MSLFGIGIRLALGIAAIVLMLWLVVRFASFTLDFVISGDEGNGEADPMFAEEAETVAPLDYSDDEEDETQFQDNSANWDTSVQTPVDKTAAELAEELEEESTEE